MPQKYEILKDHYRIFEGKIVLRIRALADFGSVKAGTLGGWLEQEANLSQEGNCWVSEEAIVYGAAQVRDNALVTGEAVISGGAFIAQNALVCGTCHISRGAIIQGQAQIQGQAFVCGNTVIEGRAKLIGNNALGDGIYLAGESVVEDSYTDTIYQNRAWCDMCQQWVRGKRKDATVRYAEHGMCGDCIAIITRFLALHGTPFDPHSADSTAKTKLFEEHT